MDLSNENIIHVKNKDLEYIQFRKLNELGIKHAYTLKSKDYNFKNTNQEIVNKSFKCICEKLNMNFNNLTRPIQTHKNVIESIKSPKLREELENVDGVITNVKDIPIATTNADCILYLIYDKKNKVIGSIHSGWRGTYQRIIENAVDLMIDKYNSKVEDIMIFICPSIRKCHFEVSKDVKDMFEEKFKFTGKLDEIIFDSKQEGKYYIDTVHLNNILLENKGILKENIIDSLICSVCNSEIVSSYRVEGKDFISSTAIISL